MEYNLSNSESLHHTPVTYNIVQQLHVNFFNEKKKGKKANFGHKNNPQLNTPTSVSLTRVWYLFMFYFFWGKPLKEWRAKILSGPEDAFG